MSATNLENEYVGTPIADHEPVELSLKLVEHLCHFCTDTGEKFRWGDFKEVHSELVQFIGVFQTLVDLVRQNLVLGDLLFRSVNDDTEFGRTNVEPTPYLQELLQDLTDAYARKDFVMVADLLQYDLFHVFIKFRDLARDLKDSSGLTPPVAIDFGASESNL